MRNRSIDRATATARIPGAALRPVRAPLGYSAVRCSTALYEVNSSPVELDAGAPPGGF